MSDSADTSSSTSKANAMNLFRALNPDIDDETVEFLKDHLNETDNSLFTLLTSSDWNLYEPNEKALEKFFKYIKAGRALVNSINTSETPAQQREAIKVLIRCLHKNLENAMNRIDEELLCC